MTPEPEHHYKTDEPNSGPVAFIRGLVVGVVIGALLSGFVVLAISDCR
jgi:hypothetical protein